MLLLLLACATPGTDTGASGVPPWQGTQIGEEGDSPCDTERVPWASEDKAPDGLSFSPSELRAALSGDFAGTLSTPHQGEAALRVALRLDGAAWLVSEVDCSDRWLELEGEVDIQAAPLFSVTAPVRMRSSWLSLELQEGDWSGTISPGELPADSGALLLSLSAHLEPGEDSAMEWILQRPEHAEVQRAGSWLLYE